MKPWEKEIHKRLDAWAETFFFQAMDNPYEKIRLYYYPSTKTEWGILETYFDGDIVGNGMEYLAEIPKSLPYSAFREWLKKIVWHLPILPTYLPTHKSFGIKNSYRKKNPYL